MKIGFTMVPNEVFQSSTWKQLKLSNREALIDLYSMRNVNDGGFLNGSKWIDVKANECFVSLNKLGDRWNVTRKTAKRYIDNLAKAGFIKVKTSRDGTRIKFLFFDEYGVKVTQPTTPHATHQSKHKVPTYNTNNTNYTKNNSSQVKKTKTGLLMGYCSRCGKQEFPKDEWQVKSGSTCCGLDYVAKRDEAMIPKIKNLANKRL
tara:strand:+ start:329 stop:940 length:612 start_codon:yes stop_codon:yes gene_type:complete